MLAILFRTFSIIALKYMYS